jgi:5-methylthioadenosine/S-adenosylhomocysteine deaminase
MGQRLLIRGGFLITMDPDLGDLADTDILVSDGKIIDIGRGIEAADAVVIDASQKVVIPGLIDTHRHTWQSVLRNSLPDDDFPTYLRTILDTFAPHYRPEDVYAGNLIGALGAINAGVTTMLDWSHIMNSPQHADAAVEALQTTRIRAVFAHGAPNVPHHDWWGDNTRNHPDDIARLRSQYFSSADQLITLAMALRGPEFTVMEVTKHDIELARSVGAPITVHVGCGGLGPKYRAISQMSQYGLLGPDITFVHCTTSTDEELKLIVESGGTVSIAPAVESQMGHGDPPFNRFSDLGLRPSLSLDVETSTASDMFTQMHAAYHTARLIAHERARAGQKAEFLTTRDILELATVQGARTLGLQDRVGSIAVGKRADLVVLDLNTVNVAPVNDVVGAVVLSADTSNVDTVIIDGNVVKSDGRLVDVDLTSAMNSIHQSRDYLYASAGRTPSRLRRLATA